jgi:hypothetical protein
LVLRTSCQVSMTLAILLTEKPMLIPGHPERSEGSGR